MTDDQRLIGRLEGDVAHLLRRTDEMDRKLDVLMARDQQMRGAKIAASVFGGVIGAIISAAASLIGVFRAH